MDSWRDDQAGDDEAEDELLDHNFGGKDAILFVIDATPSMHVRTVKNKDTDDVSSPFEMALRCLHTTLRNKIFGSPSDVIGVLLFGTREQIGVRDFNNLSVFLPFDIAEGKSILKVEEHLLEYPEKFDKEFGSVDKFHLHEVLWQCQSLFREVVGKTSTKKILLVTIQWKWKQANEYPFSGS
jgi:ATP-dependent DNA helicase 2 subunit 1